MQDFSGLRVWQASHRTTVAVYRITAGFSRSEMHGLTSQLRRATASIGANVAEGCGRGSDADARRCWQIAFGSACEALDHALLARDLGLRDADQFALVDAELLPVRRMLVRLMQHLDRPHRRALP